MVFLRAWEARGVHVNGTTQDENYLLRWNLLLFFNTQHFLLSNLSNYKITLLYFVEIFLLGVL